MKIKFALAATGGVLVGLLAGGYLAYSGSQWFVGTLFVSQIEARYDERVVLLKLIDEGKVEAAREHLLMDVQSDTIVIGNVDLPDLPYSDVANSKGRLLRFAKASGELKSVREDNSELGREASEARKKLQQDAANGD
jgi:hypothetical protein